MRGSRASPLLPGLTGIYEALPKLTGILDDLMFFGLTQAIAPSRRSAAGSCAAIIDRYLVRTSAMAREAFAQRPEYEK